MRSKGPLEGNAEKWEARCKELEVYRKEHGHSNVPSTLKSRLSNWVERQRRARLTSEAKMTAERIARLDKLGFRWTAKPQKASTKRQRIRDESWRGMYEKLKAYNEKHGHCKVPINSNGKGPGQLGPWVTIQRRDRDRMPQSRKDLLNELDFLWVATDQWDAMYEELVKFKQEHGHAEVPGDRTSLDHWCRTQRARMRQNKLPPERRGRMEEIGFNMELKSEKNERTWNAKLKCLKGYKRKHGDCLVPYRSTSKHDAELAYWVSLQRTNYKNGIIPSHRIQKLEEVGFVWSIFERGTRALSEKQEIAWEKAFQKLQVFFEVHGHFVVSRQFKNGKVNPLTSWILAQRKSYALGRMKEERRLKLEAIGFIWNHATEHLNQRKWNTHFQNLATFREEKGHTIVRRDDDMALWRWTQHMTLKRRQRTLSLEEEERLESIGFWDPPPPAEHQELGENNEESEEEGEGEDDDEECWSSNEDDADDNDDDRKPASKRHRTSSSTSKEEDEDDDDDEECWSSNEDDADDDDRKPASKRRRTTSSTSKEEEGENDDDDEECWSSNGEDDADADDDNRKPAAKRRRATSSKFTSEADADATAASKEEEAAINSTSNFARFSTGQKVKKYFAGHGWFLGEIASINEEEYCCYVRYEDGDDENFLANELEDLDEIVANVNRTFPRK